MAADMTPYRTKMQEKIKSIWQKQTRAKAEIKVVFKIQADGSVSDLKIAASSGNSKLDQKAIDAVKKAAPFGTLPAFCPSPFEADYTF